MVKALTVAELIDRLEGVRSTYGDDVPCEMVDGLGVVAVHISSATTGVVAVFTDMKDGLTTEDDWLDYEDSYENPN
jgi:hypothetical protein